MKRLNIIGILTLLLFISCSESTIEERVDYFVTTDITNFWEAFDSVNLSTDSIQQIEFLQNLFINKASVGQKAMFGVRNYQIEEYLNAIKSYPNFWKSIRPNMLKTNKLATEINNGVNEFKNIYPKMTNAKVYFTIGVFRSPGTTLDSMVLIGSEFALGDTNIITNEFPDFMQYAVDYYQTNPIKEIAFLNVHEFVHTQQKTAFEGNLLTQSLREGSAEFIAEKATNKNSTTAAIPFGKANDEKVKEKFVEEMFGFNYANWLWSSRRNEFNVRDLGYYVGYAIANKHYENAHDKTLAIKELIELDYTNNTTVADFVDKVGYFEQSILELEKQYNSLNFGDFR